MPAAVTVDWGPPEEQPDVEPDPADGIELWADGTILHQEQRGRRQPDNEAEEQIAVEIANPLTVSAEDKISNRQKGLIELQVEILAGAINKTLLEHHKLTDKTGLELRHWQLGLKSQLIQSISHYLYTTLFYPCIKLHGSYFYTHPRNSIKS